ncbi:MAG: septum formation initiator family protein, partial [Longicatena sp.]
MPKKEEKIEKTTIKAKKKKHPVRTFFCVAIMFVACFLIYSAGKDVFMTIKLKNEISSTESLITELEGQKTSLSKEKKNLEDPEYVKRFARGKFMVSKPGEQVFKLPAKNEDPGTA